MNYSTLGFPVLHYLLKFAQTHVRWVSDAIQPSQPLFPPSPPAPFITSIYFSSSFSNPLLAIRMVVCPSHMGLKFDHLSQPLPKPWRGLVLWKCLTMLGKPFLPPHLYKPLHFRIDLPEVTIYWNVCLSVFKMREAMRTSRPLPGCLRP